MAWWVVSPLPITLTRVQSQAPASLFAIWYRCTLHRPSFAGLCRLLAIDDNQMREGKYANKTIGTWPYNLA
jgi:hypothetical protein